MSQTQGFEAGKVKIIREAEALGFNYRGEKFWAVKPIYGPDNYANVGSAIERDGLLKPSFGMTIAYAHPAFLPLMSKGVQDTEDAKHVRDTIQNGLLWTFTSADYREGKGCFFYEEDDRNDFMKLSTKELEERLGKIEENKAISSDDGRLRFAPFGTYKTGILDLDELAKSSYVTAQASGAEQSGLTAEIASTFKYKPRLWALEAVNGQATRTVSLYSNWYLGDGLGVNRYFLGDGRYGYAFGVSRTGEASQQ